MFMFPLQLNYLASMHSYYLSLEFWGKFCALGDLPVGPHLFEKPPFISIPISIFLLMVAYSIQHFYHDIDSSYGIDFMCEAF